MGEGAANKMDTGELLARLAAAEAERDCLRQDFEGFISAIAHDVRGPLQVQKGLISLLLGQPSTQQDDRSLRFLKLIDHSADRLEAMVSALVEWSRVGTTGGPLLPVDVAALRVALEFDLRQSLEAGDAALSWGPAPELIFGDGRQLRRALYLLVDNAVAYHGPGKPNVHLSIEEQGAGWLLTVTDDGPGLAAQMSERVFEPFVRLDQQMDSVAAGMGLTICRRIVHRHGGEISLTPAAGGGAAFSFTLPRGTSAT